MDRWHCYLHPRARRVFALEQIEAILAIIARSVNADEDPIAPGSEDCVLWHGDLSVNEQSQLQAAICVVNKDRSKTIGFANRLLTFLFADDESYDIVRALPPTQDALPMACGNQLCVCLAHVAL